MSYLFIKRAGAIFKARNLEFFRDRASFLWSILFPFFLLAGLAVVFAEGGKNIYKVGVIQAPSTPSAFLSTRFTEFVDYKSSESALKKLRQHKIDFLVDYQNQRYWLNDTSPNGYFLEKLLLADTSDETWNKESVSGKQIRYLDWVVPGILGMNMMFSCLFGVGYVIVRYRKSMVLKRLNATPVTAMEFLTAQILSRLCIVMFISTVIFTGCHLIFDFYMLGSFIDLFVIALLGAMSLISLGLFIACRVESEELTGGLLNIVSWPMMVLSGVWFSLEGSPELVQQISNLLPLTHLVEGARSIMTDGASLIDIQHHLWALIGMTAIFLGVGAMSFKWQGQGR